MTIQRRINSIHAGMGCAEYFPRKMERGNRMAGQQYGKALAAMERDLRLEARRFVESRSAAPVPGHAVLSMLAMLGCGMNTDVADLRDPVIANPLVARLRKGLRQERTKARAGHAGYDFNRHVALHQMLKHLSAVCPAAKGSQEPQPDRGR
jgi:hypothetical protein